MNTSSHADTILTIDLPKVVHNWHVIKHNSTPATCGAVVKANAYGLGVEPVSKALFSAGCQHFFVATLDEAITLRNLLPDVFIGVFNGVREGQIEAFIDNKLTIIINNLEELYYVTDKKISTPVILHMDSGMNRLGMTYDQISTAKENGQLDALNICYIMSHLACIQEEGHPLNIEQLKTLNRLRRLFPDIPITFSNSIAGLDDHCYHFDLIRPGAGLYGVNLAHPEKDIQQVATLTTRVIQLRDIEEKGTVGYGASYDVKKGDRIAILPVGYYDGYLRSLSNKGFVYAAGKRLPIAGRVSMDLIAVDVTEAPEVTYGSEIELLGEHITVDFLAEMADTIGYEILTSLGHRYERRYVTE